MKKGIFIYIYILMSLATAVTLERFEYSKQYIGSVFSGGREQITVDVPEMQKMLILKNVVTKVDLFESNARVRIFYTLENKDRRNSLGFTLSYPKIDMNLGTERMIRDSSLNSVLSTEYEDRVLFGNYNDFTVTIDGVPEDYVNETDIEFETNIPFRIGNESLTRNDDGTYTDNEVSSYLYRYGWYHVALRIDAGSSSVVVISYSVPLYQNTVTIMGSDDVNFEDPALNYDYYDLPDGKRLLSDRIFSFYNYVPYESDVRAKKRVYEFYSRLPDAGFLNFFPLKYKTSRKCVSFVYSGDRFAELDNLYVKMSEYNNPENVPSYYFDVTPDAVSEAGKTAYIFDKQHQQILLKYNKKNKRTASSLLPKRDGISVREIRVTQGAPLANMPAKSGNVKFEITMSLKDDFSDASSFVTEVNFGVYDEYNPKTFILYKGDAVSAKNIKLRVLGDNSGNIAPIVLSHIQIIQ